MEIRNNANLPQSSVAFKARIEKNLANELKNEGAKVSVKMLDIIDERINLIRGWGQDASEVSASFSLENGTRELALFNENISSSYGARLPQRGNILSSFLNLRKSDILKAERNIEETVSNNKMDLIAKAIQDEKLAQKITGKVNFSDEEFALAIDRLSEEEITNLRFGLDQKPAETGKIIDFVG